MKHLLLIVGCLLWPNCTSASPAPLSNPLEGEWVGGYETQEGWTLVKVRFTPNRRGGDAELDLARPGQSQKSSRSIRCALDEAHLRCEGQMESGRVTFDGNISGTGIAGALTEGGKPIALHLAQVAQIRPGVIDKYIGSYRLGPRKFISISYASQTGGLKFLEFTSGDTGVLYPATETIFFAGPTYLIPAPVEARITFQKNTAGAVTGLVYSRKGAPDLAGEKVGLNQEEIVFHHKDARLAGTLITPATSGPHPAVVMIAHESQNTYLEWANLFASHGLAVLRYDKRGHGRSTGEFHRATYIDHVGDALAGLHTLQSRKDINPRQIGLWGISWAGWVAQLAAATSKDVAFIMPLSGPAVPPWRQEIYKMEPLLRADGYAEQEIKEAVAFMKLKFEVARTGQGWEQLSAMWERLESKGWAQYAEMSPRLEWLQLLWEVEWSYDPLPALEKITCPVLAIFGGRDVWVPVTESTAILERALTKAGNKDFTIKVFPEANHGMWEAKTGGPKEFSSLKRRVGAYHDLMIDWLLKRVTIVITKTGTNH